MSVSRGLIERLRTLPAFVEDTVARMSAADVMRTPAAGGFSLIEHVCHLRDYDDEGCVQRIARMLAEDEPALPDFAGATLARERNYRDQDLSSAVAAFSRNRARTTVMAGSLSSTDVARTARLGTHGLVTVRDLLEIVADHDDEHRREIEALVHELDVEHLRAMARGFVEGFNTGDVDRLMQYYGETYVDVNLRRPVQSHAERRAYFSQIVARSAMRIDVRLDDIAIDGAIAIVRGSIDIRIPVHDGSGESVRELRYLEVARKGPDGSWKSVCGMDGPIQDA
jgi:ketosteroid isomerase-like protein